MAQRAKNSTAKRVDTNKAIGLGVIAAACIIGILYFVFNTPAQINVAVGGQTYKVLVASNDQQWVHGLMNYQFSCDQPGECTNGMLFEFPNSSDMCFWMENTPEPLYQIWILNGTVEYWTKAVPESTANICSTANQVLELYSKLPVNISLGEQVVVEK